MKLADPGIAGSTVSAFDVNLQNITRFGRLANAVRTGTSLRQEFRNRFLVIFRKRSRRTEKPSTRPYLIELSGATRQARTADLLIAN